MRFKANTVYKLRNKYTGSTFTGKLLVVHLKNIKLKGGERLTGKDQNGKRCHLLINGLEKFGWEMVE